MPAEIVNGDLPESIASAIRGTGRVAVDTETSGLHWSTDLLHLCQLYTDETGPVLVRDAGHRPAHLASVLGDPEIIKVFHFAPFDLRFLESGWGVRAVRVSARRQHQKLLHPSLAPSDHSLQPLLMRHLGIEIEKGPMRISDWGTASLTPEQIAYATDDVAHLLPLVDVLRAQLAASDRLGLYEQVCAYLPVDAHLEVSGIPNPLAY